MRPPSGLMVDDIMISYKVSDKINGFLFSFASASLQLLRFFRGGGGASLPFVFKVLRAEKRESSWKGLKLFAFVVVYNFKVCVDDVFFLWRFSFRSRGGRGCLAS